MAIPRNLSNLAPGADSSGILGVTKGGTGAASLTANNVLLGNGTSAVQFVAPGSSGNVLTSNGTTWASSALPASGAFQFVSTLTASSSSSLEWTGLTGDKYFITLQAIVPSVSNAYLICQIGTGSSPSYLTSGYEQLIIWYYTNPPNFSGSQGRSNWLISSFNTGILSPSSGVSGSFYLLGMNTGGYPSISGSASAPYSAGNIETNMYSGMQQSNTTQKTAIKLSMLNSGTILSGSASLYSISN